MDCIFKPYTEEELLSQLKFKVYLNYLESISTALDSTYFKETKHLRSVAESNTFKSIRPKQVDYNKIKTLLRNAWFTEIQLNFTSNHPEFVGYSNHWASVQLYYAVYLAIRALFVAMNQSFQGNHQHASNLREISREIEKRPELFPIPWCMTCSGDPNDDKNIMFNNLPKNVKISLVSALSPKSNFWDSYALFLKTTRKKMLEDKRQEWLYKNKKKKLTLQGRRGILDKMPPTTIFDCLFRLRVRANYQDVELFLMTIEDQESASRFNYSLRNTLKHTLQVIELLIARYLGKDKYHELIHNFIKDENHGNHSNIRERWELLSSLW